MQPEEQVDFDGFPESLERRLRDLPKLAVPNDLEARLLAAIPTNELIAIRNRMRASRANRRLMSAWVTAFAAACLAMALLRPKFEDLVSMLSVTVRPGQSATDHKRLVERPDEDALHEDASAKSPKEYWHVHRSASPPSAHSAAPAQSTQRFPTIALGSETADLR